MDIRLSHSRPRLELHWGLVAECGVTPPIIEHIDVLKDVLCRFVPCVVLVLEDEFALESPEKTLHTSIGPTVPPPQHAAGYA